MSDRPTYDVKTDFYIILIVPITFNIINLFGSSYIFYRTYLRWKFDYRKISLSFRFPFYISITDFLVSSLGLTNFLYSAVKGPTAMLNGGVITWPSPFCQVLAFSSTVSILANILLVGAISITTWIRVVRECYIKFGKYDYKIWLPVIFLSLLIPLITVHSFGPQKYWCGGDGNKLLTALMTSAIMITLLVIVVCYVHVLKAIHNVKDELSDSHSNSVHRTDIERKCLRKVLTYIFVFILQYIPIVIFEVCRYMKVRHIIMFALAPSAISIGGIGNIIQYLRNEGFSAPSAGNASSSNSRLQGSGQQSGTTDSVNISVTENME